MNNQINFLLVIMSVCAFLLVGCLEIRPRDPEDQATATAEMIEEKVEDIEAGLSLAGTAWELDYFFEPDERLPVLPGTRLTTYFLVDRYGGFSGCNWYLGIYEADETELRMYTAAETPGICTPPAVMEQEATFKSAMVNVIEYELQDEQLIGYTTDKQRMLTYRPADAVSFEGTTWSLKFQWNGDRYVPSLPGSEVTALFEGDQLSGSAGCNDYSTTFERNEVTQSLSVGAIEATEQNCTVPEDVMSQESLYLENLSTVARYGQVGGMLILVDPEEVSVLIFGAM